MSAVFYEFDQITEEKKYIVRQYMRIEYWCQGSDMG